MAQRTVTILTCDRCAAEGKEADGVDSVSFGFEGFAYNLDLCEGHFKDVTKTIEELVSWSSERSPQGRRGRRTGRKGAAADPIRIG